MRGTDVPELVGCFDGIKMDKRGGIRRGLQIIHAPRLFGLKVVLGCMIGSSLYIAAPAQLSPLTDWLDLDGHLLLADDPFAGWSTTPAGSCCRVSRDSGSGRGVHGLGAQLKRTTLLFANGVTFSW